MGIVGQCEAKSLQKGEYGGPGQYNKGADAAPSLNSLIDDAGTAVNHTEAVIQPRQGLGCPK